MVAHIHTELRNGKPTDHSVRARREVHGNPPFCFVVDAYTLRDAGQPSGDGDAKRAGADRDAGTTRPADVPGKQHPQACCSPSTSTEDTMTDLSHLPLWGQLLIAADTAVVAFMSAHGLVRYLITPLF